jgi:hypothetical protein
MTGAAIRSPTVGLCARQYGRLEVDEMISDTEEHILAEVLDQRIELALHEVRFAQAELSLAVGELKPLTVGDKHLITRDLEQFFEKLRKAQRSVADLQRMRSRLS